MANGTRTGDPRGFNKGRSSKFRAGSRVRQIPEEGRRTYRPKRCGNNNEDNSPKTLNDKNHQASFQKFVVESFTLLASSRFSRKFARCSSWNRLFFFLSSLFCIFLVQFFSRIFPIKFLKIFFSISNIVPIKYSFLMGYQIRRPSNTPVLIFSIDKNRKCQNEILETVVFSWQCFYELLHETKFPVQRRRYNFLMLTNG